MVTPEMILQVRYELGDTEISLPILADEEYTYFLIKNNESIRRSALDAAKTILLKLSMSAGRKTVDILSIDSSRSASAYRDALLAYIKNPELSGLLNGVSPYAGGISKADMKKNVDTTDNNVVKNPAQPTDFQMLGGFNPVSESVLRNELIDMYNVNFSEC